MNLSKPGQRIVVIDVDATDLSTKEDRVVELGMIELLDGKKTGRSFHSYFNPGKEFKNTSNLSTQHDWAWLQKQPRFGALQSVITEFLDDAVGLTFYPNSLYQAKGVFELLDSEFSRCQRITGASSLVQSKISLVDFSNDILGREPRRFRSSKVLSRKLGLPDIEKTEYPCLDECENMIQIYQALEGFEFDMEYRSSNGLTPFLAALLDKKMALVLELFKHGANPQSVVEIPEDEDSIPTDFYNEKATAFDCLFKIAHPRASAPFFATPDEFKEVFDLLVKFCPKERSLLLDKLYFYRQNSEDPIRQLFETLVNQVILSELPKAAKDLNQTKVVSRI